MRKALQKKTLLREGPIIEKPQMLCDAKSALQTNQSWLREFVNSTYLVVIGLTPLHIKRECMQASKCWLQIVQCAIQNLQKRSVCDACDRMCSALQCMSSGNMTTLNASHKTGGLQSAEKM